MCAERPEYITIPAEWLRFARGNAFRVALYFAGVPRDESGRKSCESIGAIARACEIRRDHVGEAIRQLEEAGFVGREPRGHGFTYYLLEGKE